MPGGQASPYAELQFEAPAGLPAGVTPLYWYKLFDETGAALPAYSDWVAIAIGGEAGASSTPDGKFKYKIWTAVPGEYKAQVEIPSHTITAQDVGMATPKGLGRLFPATPARRSATPLLASPPPTPTSLITRPSRLLVGYANLPFF